MSAIAIHGDYTDLRFIKSRKVAVISIEIPIEAASAFVGSFGTPSPATGVPVALARLQTVKEQPQATGVPSEVSGPQLSQQAFFLCQTEAFKSYLIHRFGVDDPAGYIRSYCSVASRADIIPGTPAAEKFYHLRAEFDIWRRAI